jgi:uncharacterized surface protein with fasciclin (FAS1) repeats
MARLHLLLALLSALRAGASRSFVDAISSYPDLSNFTYLIQQYPAFATTLLNATGNVTILVPSNTAFLSYQAEFGQNIESLDSNVVEHVLQYHTLNATVKTQDLTQPGGAVVGSQLVDPTYNNRGKWSQSNAHSPGQVVYISAASTAGSARERGIAARDEGTTASVTSGDGAIAKINAVDGVWDGGVFQVVDQ